MRGYRYCLSEGPIPNFETRCSVPARNEKYSQMLVSSHVRSAQPGRADTPGLQALSCSTSSLALLCGREQILALRIGENHSCSLSSGLSFKEGLAGPHAAALAQ